jgi:hypothetical protein
MSALLVTTQDLARHRLLDLWLAEEFRVGGAASSGA